MISKERIRIPKFIDSTIRDTVINQKRNGIILTKIIVATTALLLCKSSWGGCFGVEVVDAPFLPKYCQFCVQEQGRESPDAQRWTRILGDSAKGLHHYCAAINFSRHSVQATGKKQKQFIAGQAYRNFEYVLERWPKDSKLYPEALSRTGRLLESMGRNVEAAQYYQKSILIKPKYVAAYAAYSDLVIKQGNKDEAIAILKRGLTQVPGSSMLLRRLSKLQ